LGIKLQALYLLINCHPHESFVQVLTKGHTNCNTSRSPPDPESILYVLKLMVKTPLPINFICQSLKHFND
jgi:hypothetical protein